MEGSDATHECSKTSPNSDQSEDETDEINHDTFKQQNGSSSSNSTVEENGKKQSVRPYVRSKTPRLRWTPDLHLRFLRAVERHGGPDRATPKLVLEMMSIKGLRIAHVKSHLQMYRSKKIDDPRDQGGDRNIYNLSQLPMIQGFNPRHDSRFRCGDNSWSGIENWMHSPYRSRHIHENTLPQFYGTFAEMNFGSNYKNSSNQDIHNGTYSLNEKSSWRTHDSKYDFRPSFDLQSCKGQFGSSPIELKSAITLLQSEVQGQSSLLDKSINYLDLNPSISPLEGIKVKRKASHFDLDLNLSLGLAQKNDERKRGMECDEDESDLSLSLYSLPSKSSKLKRLLEEDGSKKNARKASTLDLTI